DIFAPVAGALSNGVRPEELGALITDYVRLAPLAPARAADGTLNASIIHIDRFGNCVTNITRRELSAAEIKRGVVLHVGAQQVRSFRRCFAEADADAQHLFAIWGSAGFLEIAAAQASAAQLLGVERGQTVIVQSPKSNV